MMMMMAHGNLFYPAIVIWILCITVRVTLSEDLDLVEQGETGKKQQLDNVALLLLPREQRSAARVMIPSDLPEQQQARKDPSNLVPWEGIVGSNELSQKATQFQDPRPRKEPDGLILYTAKIINLLRLKRGISVISRLFPRFLFPASRARTTAYEQRVVSDDYYSEIPARRGPSRPFRPRLRWG